MVNSIQNANVVWGIANGGTGGKTRTAARENLGIYTNETISATNPLVSENYVKKNFIRDYKTLASLGLAEKVSITELFAAMENGTTLTGNAAMLTTDPLPTNFGLLEIVKITPQRAKINFIDKSTGDVWHLGINDDLTLKTEWEKFANKSYVDSFYQEISDIVPAQANINNKLADKDFVNSTVGTNTANYISNEGQPFHRLSDLQAYTGEVTNNDYAFVTGTDTKGNPYYDRYKATVENGIVTWAKEYRLNNSSFTAEQWATIQSGFVAEDKTKLDNLSPVAISGDYNDLINKPDTPAGGGGLDGFVCRGFWSEIEQDYHYSCIILPIDNPNFQNGQTIRVTVLDDVLEAANSTTAEYGLNICDNTTTQYSYGQIFVNTPNGVQPLKPVQITSRDTKKPDGTTATMTNKKWFLQAYTTLELMYVENLYNGQSGFLVIGNPIVLSNNKINNAYALKANGEIEFLDSYNLEFEKRTVSKPSGRNPTGNIDIITTDFIFHLNVKFPYDTISYSVETVKDVHILYKVEKFSAIKTGSSTTGYYVGFTYDVIYPKDIELTDVR